LIVLDTSALVAFLVGADMVAERVRAASVGERLAAPHGVDLECASALRGLARRGKLPEDEARRALDLLAIIELKRYDHVPLLPRIWQLRHNLWPYDAAYVALAESLDVDVVTLDGKLARTPHALCTIRNLRENGITA
jgi:predicted nucleic acid-binding protein